MKEINVRFDSRKKFRMLLFFILFEAGLMALLYYLAFVSRTIYVVYILLLAVIVAIGLWAVVSQIISLFRDSDKAGLTVNSEGVLFKGTKLGRSIGLVPWGDIEGVYEGKMYGADYIFLRFANPAKYVAKVSQNLHETIETNGLPVSHSELEISYDELRALLSRSFNEMK